MTCLTARYMVEFKFTEYLMCKAVEDAVINRHVTPTETLHPANQFELSVEKCRLN